MFLSSTGARTSMLRCPIFTWRAEESMERVESEAFEVQFALSSQPFCFEFKVPDVFPNETKLLFQRHEPN